MQIIILFILLLPLLGFLSLGLSGKYISRKSAGLIASSSVFINFILSCVLFIEITSHKQPITLDLFDWITFADLSIPFSFLVDQLSVLMLLIINGVGTLIHLYSIGYMKEDEGVKRYFSYLNLFVFFMLVLVMGANYLLTFIGWEGVGLSSYLLIGFWFKDHANNDAAKKAFIMNRIGDLGFLIALFLLISTYNTLNFSEIANIASQTASGSPVMFWITLCLFIGAMGKSAQFPLFTWLPDAMAGPTPVSALIHAATMVTAGIYLVVRSSALFILSPLTMNIVLWVGIITAILGGITAIFQNDIKKILAYSTVSQLGFLFLALGLGSFSGSMFHLTTHAFFKALLFLGAGSVIHALNNEQDIRKMGGLSKKIPFTFVLFLIGTIAISGLPPFAGFFSKEMILTAAFEHGILIGLTATFISLLTAVYMFRLLVVVFLKPASEEVTANHHIHESPKVMLYPMSVLAILSILGGWIQTPHLFGHNNAFESFLSPILPSRNPNAIEQLSATSEWLILLLPLTFITLIIVWTYNRYTKSTSLPTTGKIFKLGVNRFYLDEIYQFSIIQPTMYLSDFLREFIDQRIINNAVDGIGSRTLWLGKILRRLQTGNVGFYYMLMVLCIIAILFFNLIL